MLETFFQYMLWVTVLYSPFILLLLACRKGLRRRYTAGAVYVLWLILLLRMVVSYTPSIAYLPFPAAEGSAQQDGINQGQDFSEIPVIQPAGDLQESPDDSNAVPSLWDSVNPWPALSFIWLGGASLYGGAQLVAAVRFKKQVRRRAAPVTDAHTFAVLQQQCVQLNVRRTPKIIYCPGAGGPALTGILRPTLLLEKPTQNPIELEMTLRHELCHLRRRDLLVKRLLVCAKALHWFNPLVWLAAREALREMELACDDMATRGLQRQQREQYGQSILAALGQQTRGASVASTAMAGSAEYIRHRLDNLFGAAGRKKGVVLAVAVLLTSSLLVSCVAPAPQAQSPEAPSNSEFGSLPPDDSREYNDSALMTESPVEPTNSLGTVTLDWVELRYYNSGDPYISYGFTNYTTDTIVGATLAWAAYDAEGNPLELYWFSISDPMTGLAYIHSFTMDMQEEEYSLAPGEAYDIGGGWSIYDGWHGGQEHDIAYLNANIVSIEFKEHGLWENPEYNLWYEQTLGIPISPDTLEMLSIDSRKIVVE